MTNTREFDCSRDLLKVAGKAVRLTPDCVFSLTNAESENVLPYGFFDRARKGMDRKEALTSLLGAMRKCVGPNGDPLVDLLAIVIGPEAAQAKTPTKKSSGRGISPPARGLTPSGRLFRR